MTKAVKIDALKNVRAIPSTTSQIAQARITRHLWRPKKCGRLIISRAFTAARFPAPGVAFCLIATETKLFEIYSLYCNTIQ